jgi:molybdate transport system substrate-binding protein
MKMNRLKKFAALIPLAIGVTSMNPIATAAELVIFSAGAVKPALSVLAPIYEARSGHRLQITYATAGDLRRKLAAGERADIVILPLENFAAVEKDGVTNAATRVDLGAVGIGVAVKAGAKLPDLSNEEGVKRALLAAKTITFMDPNRGTSGKHLDEVVLPKLAIRDVVRAKTTLGEGGMIAEKVVSGEIEIAFQQMTELLPVKGITIAGVLPPSLQKTTTYSAAVMKVATSPKEAADLLGYLIGKEGRAEFVLRGFTTP